MMVEAVLLADRVMVWDDEVAGVLQKEFYGKPAGGGLQLSLTESAYLLRKGRLHIVEPSKNELTEEEFWKAAGAVQPDFDVRYRAYEDLRDRGLVVKTGFKYGAHFRVYADPIEGHAKYLVHAVPPNFESTWPEISRAIRLAHSVKKEMLFAIVRDEAVDYVRIKRVTP